MGTLTIIYCAQGITMVSREETEKVIRSWRNAIHARSTGDLSALLVSDSPEGHIWAVDPTIVLAVVCGQPVGTDEGARPTFVPGRPGVLA